jgi:hypothetical protein
MSANVRLLWFVPAFLLASWLAVRSLAAESHLELGDPQPRAASSEIRDPALAQLISELAARARKVN